MCCTKCGIEFDSTKLFVHLKKHSTRGIGGEALDMKYISVVINGTTIHHVLRAKMQSAFDEIKKELQSSGICAPYIPHMETEYEDWGMAYMVLLDNINHNAVSMKIPLEKAPWAEEIIMQKRKGLGMTANNINVYTTSVATQTDPMTDPPSVVVAVLTFLVSLINWASNWIFS